jgi:hypothetical protein
MKKIVGPLLVAKIFTQITVHGNDISGDNTNPIGRSRVSVSITETRPIMGLHMWDTVTGPSNADIDVITAFASF